MKTDSIKAVRIFGETDVKSILLYVEQELGQELKRSKGGFVSAIAIQQVVNRNVYEFLALYARDEMGLLPPWEKADSKISNTAV